MTEDLEETGLEQDLSDGLGDQAEQVEAEEKEYRIPGPFKRNGPLFIGIILMILMGPWISHRLNSYRAIVLERDGEKALLYFEYQPPKWVVTDAGEPGAILLKEVGDGGPHVVESLPADYDIMQRCKLYRSYYHGEIVHIKQPAIAKGAATATILTERQKRVKVELWSNHFTGAAVGRKLIKKANSWEPRLVAEKALSLDAQLDRLDGNSKQ